MEVEHKILPQEGSSLNFFFFLARKIIDRTHLVVVRTVGAFLDAGVFFLVAYLDTDDRVHVQSGQLPRFDDRHTHLEVLRLEVIVALGQILDPEVYRNGLIKMLKQFEKRVSHILFKLFIVGVLIPVAGGIRVDTAGLRKVLVSRSGPTGRARAGHRRRRWIVHVVAATLVTQVGRATSGQSFLRIGDQRSPFVLGTTVPSAGTFPRRVPRTAQLHKVPDRP